MVAIVLSWHNPSSHFSSIGMIYWDGLIEPAKYTDSIGEKGVCDAWDDLTDVLPLLLERVEALEQRQPYSWLKRALVLHLPTSILRGVNKWLRRLATLDRRGWCFPAMSWTASWFRTLLIRPRAISDNWIFWSTTRGYYVTTCSSKCLKMTG